ncbi:hypothetical protein KC332_g7997 [Hortaea werneckii]|nr:hypothetical protein KC358_g10725 [Hortaea werneckii]KAI6918364.1 hypothetical protein KC348_g10948 [Hortaea werneckii]KAI6930063.1 hypothetical protein KC341_g10472 [Hortaea werneckii]KAI6964292.1 hypothetical protein KC321_g10751 [Hortaea werneckii]KAI6984286.1 hypothetical protein KC329_g7868 [Hortaea werneckii]
MSDSDSIKAYQILRTKLPALRFDDGDVVVKLGVEPHSHLLVHSERVKLAMPTLAPMFKAEWSTSETIVHPVTGKEVKVYSLGMKSVDSTLLLEGKDVDLQEEHSVLFNRSELLADGWPVLDSASLSMELHAVMAEFAHRVIFALLYGYEVQTAALTARWEDSDGFGPRCVSPLRYTETVMQILSYAEYYGCFDRILPAFREIVLEEGESLWRDVAERSYFWIQFAMKLQSTKIYCDAVQHYIVQNRSDERTPEWATCNYTERPSDRYEAPWYFLNMMQEEYTEKIQPALNKLDAVLGRLERNLHQLQLQPYHYRFSCERATARTTFLNFLTRQAKRHPHRSDNAHLWERCEFLARSLWGQWLVQQLHGEHVYTGGGSGKDRSKRAGPLNVICRKIVETSKSKDPSRLVGYKPAERISSIFQLGRGWQKREAERRVKLILDVIVQQAAEIVEKAFEVEEWSFWDGGVEHRFVTRRCEYDEHDGFFTYLTLEETDVPWKCKEGRMQSLPEVDMAEACSEWLEAVRISMAC